ncbi:MAG: ABC transporter ATP-binding protein [Planctomycetaceae bacterium]|nr:ABC transporter ATP-binding protein [Planctomycetaceae bacterium]
MSLIRTEHLTRSYGSRRGVEDICLSVDEGEIYRFLGPNGAGKSTTIRLLLGFLRPSSGRAEIFGRDCQRHSAEIRRDVGYVAGDVRLYPWLTLQRALRIVGDIRGRDLTSRGSELAELFQLQPDLPVRKMSRGNRQKLALVTALAHDPRLVILDEPTSGLDPLMQDVLADCLRRMAAAGKTVFFSSHALAEVESLCGRVAIIRDGRIVAAESVRELKRRAPRRVRIRYVSPEAARLSVVPEGLTTISRTNDVVELELIGESADLIRWAANEPVVDLGIGEPGLESLFRRYYSDPEA